MLKLKLKLKLKFISAKNSNFNFNFKIVYVPLVIRLRDTWNIHGLKHSCTKLHIAQVCQWVNTQRLPRHKHVHAFIKTLIQVHAHIEKHTAHHAGQ